MLGTKVQKHIGLVVLRGDIVKDGSGSCAVFTEQSSSASQMTAIKVMDVICKDIGLRRISSQRSISKHQSQNGGCSMRKESSKDRMPRNLNTSSSIQMAKMWVEIRRSCGS